MTQPKSPDEPRYPKAKCGVKFSAETEREIEREPPLPLDNLFGTYAEDIRHAHQDARSSLAYHRNEIERYKTGDREQMAKYARQCYGSKFTIEDAIEKHIQGIASAAAELAEIEADPGDHETSLCHVLELASGTGAYAEARDRFCRLYGSDHLMHTQFLIGRAATEGEMNCRRNLHARGQWGEDERWRMGDHSTSINVDPMSAALGRPIINRGAIRTPGQMVDASLATAEKVAVIAKFYEKNGNENRRLFWGFWLNRELSTLSQATGIDYELTVTGSSLPPRRTIERWEVEVNVLDSEDQAKLRRWESVYHFWNYAEEKDEEDAEWAAYLEEQAEKGRQWALEKRERFLRRGHSGRSLFVLGRRFGSRPRQSRGRSSRCRGSRRVTSSSSSGDPPDEAEGDGEAPSPVISLVAPYATPYGRVNAPLRRFLGERGWL